MTDPKCPRCGGAIPANDIHVGKDIAFCRPCNAVHSLSSLARDAVLDEGVDLQQPPAGCWRRSEVSGEVIGGSHRSLGTAVVMCGVMLFWNGIVSVFVTLAVAATVRLLGVDLPGWAPVPKMNGEIMGVGMTVFLWLFLTPFIIIGLGLLYAFLDALAGRTEVRIGQGQASVTTGIGPVGWTKRFATSAVKGVRLDDQTWRDSDGDSQRKTKIVVELPDGGKVSFGSSLPEQRRRFVAAAVKRGLAGAEQR